VSHFQLHCHPHYLKPPPWYPPFQLSFASNFLDNLIVPTWKLVITIITNFPLFNRVQNLFNCQWLAKNSVTRLQTANWIHEFNLEGCNLGGYLWMCGNLDACDWWGWVSMYAKTMSQSFKVRFFRVVTLWGLAEVVGASLFFVTVSERCL
jgi:hypothetical protein